VLHDTALQDTSLVNGLIALAIYLLLRLRFSLSPRAALASGAVLAIAVLTTARVAFIVPGVLVWVSLAGGTSRSVRWKHATLVAIPVVLLVGGWIARNARVVGAPVLTTEGGKSLWTANSAETFEFFPVRSIDLASAASFERLPPARASALAELREKDVARDRLMASWAMEEIAGHPMRTLQNGVRKVWVVVSAELSPARSDAVQIAYRLIFGLVHAFAAAQLWMSRHEWRLHGPLLAVLASFGVTTAIFWAHTSHKSLIDVPLFVYAGAMIRSRLA
jgi:hypothetical protein